MGLSNPLIRLVWRCPRCPNSSLFYQSTDKLLGKRLGQLQPFDAKIRATAIPSDRALKIIMYHGLHFGLLHTSNLFPLKIISAGGLEWLMLQIDASHVTIKIFC